MYISHECHFFCYFDVCTTIKKADMRARGRENFFFSFQISMDTIEQNESLFSDAFWSSTCSFHSHSRPPPLTCVESNRYVSFKPLWMKDILHTCGCVFVPTFVYSNFLSYMRLLLSSRISMYITYLSNDQWTWR